MKIKRDLNNKIIAGVCAGLAKHFDIPVWKIRLVFIILALMGAAGVVIYILLWFLLPADKHMIDV